MIEVDGDYREIEDEVVKKHRVRKPKVKRLLIGLMIISIIFTLNFISASYSDCSLYGNCQPVAVTSTGGGGNNITNYNNYTTNNYNSIGVNSTQMENATILNIKESWLYTFLVNIGLINNASYLNTYNSTYAGYPTTWNSSILQYLNSGTNASYLSTYNSTYDSYGLNVSRNWTLFTNSTYGIWWFNQTANLVQTYWFNQTLNLQTQWLFNQTLNLVQTYWFNQTANLNLNGNVSWNESRAGSLYALNSTINAGFCTLNGSTFTGNVNITGILYVNGSIVGSGVPSGAIMAFNSASCPTGWILADGTSGTPDLRGIFIRGSGTNGVLSMANGTAFNAGYGTYQNDSFQDHTHRLYGSQTAGTGFGGVRNDGVQSQVLNDDDVLIAHGGAGSPRTGTETHPASYVVTYCVKTGSDNATGTIWGQSGSNAFVQNTSLNVGIGTLTPTQKLDVAGNVNLSSSGNLTAHDGLFSGDVNASRISTTGSVGIGKIPNTNPLEVQGSSLFIGNVSLSVSGNLTAHDVLVSGDLNVTLGTLNIGMELIGTKRNGTWALANCSAGKTIISGGCASNSSLVADSLLKSLPNNFTVWNCTYARSVQIYASVICGRIH